MTALIEAHIAHMRAAGKALNTIEDRTGLLHRVDQQLPHGIARAATEELEAWLGNADWAPATRRLYYAHLHAFYQWATRGHHPYLSWDPTDDMEVPKAPAGVPRPVTDAQLSHALTHAHRPLRTVVILSAYAGMRAGEVAGTSREALLQEEIPIMGKGGKVRLVPNHPLIRGELPHLPPGPILVDQHGQPIPAARAATHISRQLTAIGLPEVSLHRFRHWYATWLLRPQRLGGAGADLRTVQELMGHSSPTTTARYTQITSEQRRLAVYALPTPASNPVEEAA